MGITEGKKLKRSDASDTLHRTLKGHKMKINIELCLKYLKNKALSVKRRKRERKHIKS